LKLRDRKVADHLSDMRLVEILRNFGVHDHSLINNQIRDQVPYLLSTIENTKSFLLINLRALRTKFE